VERAGKSALGAFILLEPSCLLALVALVPRALAAPSSSTYAALVIVSLVECAPFALVARALLRPAEARV
jgi:hypothetical protein